MATNTPTQLATTRGGEFIPLTVPTTALAKTYDATISAATDITLDTRTTLIEVTALDKGIFLRYAATASSANFDEFIAPGTTRHFIKPDGVTVISVIEETATAKVVVIEK